MRGGIHPPLPEVSLYEHPVIYNGHKDSNVVRGNVSRAYARGGFGILRHDGAYRMLTSVNKQPKSGARIRASELVDGVGRLRVAHTLTTGAGETAGAKVSFRGNMRKTSSFTRDMRSVPDSAARYAAAVRILFSDRARDLNLLDKWAVLPNSLCVVRDPLRMRLEVES